MRLDSMDSAGMPGRSAISIRIIGISFWRVSLRFVRRTISDIDPAADEDWNHYVEAIIVPGAGLSDSQRKMIELDYGMKDGRFVLRVREALLFYYLRQLGLLYGPGDCMPTEQTELANRKELEPFFKKHGIEAGEAGIALMAKSLKEKNQPQLITFVLANAVGLGILLEGLKQMLFLLDSLSKGNIAVIFRLVAIPAGLALLIGILGWAVPKRWKETVIFWRTDKNCLPSSRAFSVIALNDPRIDRRRLAKKHGPLPTAPGSANRVVVQPLQKKRRERRGGGCPLRLSSLPRDDSSRGEHYDDLPGGFGVVILLLRTILVGASVIAAEYLLLLLSLPETLPITLSPMCWPSRARGMKSGLCWGDSVFQRKKVLGEMPVSRRP